MTGIVAGIVRFVDKGLVGVFLIGLMSLAGCADNPIRYSASKGEVPDAGPGQALLVGMITQTCHVEGKPDAKTGAAS